MNEELKQKWLKALRGREYKQTKRALRTLDGFCCLGVLCDVIDPNKWSPNPSDSIKYNYDFGLGTLESSVVCQNVHKELGSALGDLKDTIEYKGGYFACLTELNDAGMSFEEIADIIEKQF